MNYTITLTPHDVLWTLRALETARKAIIVTDDPTRALAQTYDALITKYGELQTVPAAHTVDNERVLRWANEHGFGLVNDDQGLARTLPDGRVLILTALEGPELPPTHGPVSYAIYASEGEWEDGQEPVERGQLMLYYHALRFIDHGAFERKQAD